MQLTKVLALFIEGLLSFFPLCATNIANLY